MKNSKLHLFAIAFIVLFIGGAFWYSKHPISATHNSDQPKIVYATNYFDSHGGPTKKEIHAVNLDGTKDKVIYSTVNNQEYIEVANHTHVLVSEVSPENIIQKFFDKDGNSIKNVYDNFLVTSHMYEENGYSSDRKNVATFDWKSENSEGSLQIKTLNLLTRAIKEYSCSVCVGPQQEGNFHQIRGWSADNAKVYFSISRDDSHMHPGSEPNNKYFSLDLRSGNITPLALSSKFFDYYRFYPEYGMAFKMPITSFATDPASITGIDLNDFSEKFVFNSLPMESIQGFNGKYILYKVLFPNFKHNVIRSINVETKEQKDVLPVGLVNTSKEGDKDVLAFLPDKNNTFLYKVEYDNGWEVRTHDIATEEDRNVLFLTAEQLKDGMSSYKEYLGVIF